MFTTQLGCWAIVASIFVVSRWHSIFMMPLHHVFLGTRFSVNFKCCWCCSCFCISVCVVDNWLSLLLPYRKFMISSLSLCTWFYCHRQQHFCFSVFVCDDCHYISLLGSSWFHHYYFHRVPFDVIKCSLVNALNSFCVIAFRS